MKKEIAQYAEKSFLQENTQKTRHVPESAKLSFVGIKEIKPRGKQSVYNMEVEKYHNFSVNGGVIVHNCMDDIRYFCNTILIRHFPVMR